MNQDKLPLVSIIITSYNRADLISDAIESALAQNYPNLEIILSDNCSTDHTDSVISKYLSDGRIRYSRNDTNIGMLPNFRKAVYELAKGKFISFISSDDKLTDQNFISEAVGIINKYENILLVFTRNQARNTEGLIVNTNPEYPYFEKEIWDGSDVFFKSPEYGFLSWGGCVIEKNALADVRGLQSDYIFADMESNYKIMLSGNVGFINKVCYESFLHDANASGSKKAEVKISQLKCLSEIGEYAKSILPKETDKIEQWKNYFINVLGYNDLKILKKSSENEFIIFKKYFMSAYPVEYKRIIAKWKYLLFMLFYSIKNKLKID